MKCEEANSLLEALYDGGLNPQLRIQVEKHAAACSSCAIKLKQLCALSGLLQKSTMPPPSPDLKENLMEAFRQNYETAVKKPAWWQRIFAGSISVPKPAFAAVAALVVFGFIAAAMLGRATSPLISAVEVSSPPSVIFEQPPPKVIEQTRIIEVPVIQERVITKVVYTERQNTSKTQKQSRLSEGMQPGLSARNKSVEFSRNLSDSVLNGSVGKNAYFTQTNLSQFQPTSEMKPRIVREVNSNEK